MSRMRSKREAPPIANGASKPAAVPSAPSSSPLRRHSTSARVSSARTTATGSSRLVAIWQRGLLVARQDRPGPVGQPGDVVQPAPARTRRPHQHPQVLHVEPRASCATPVSISTVSTRGMYNVPSPPMASSSSELTKSSGTGGFATTNGP